MNGSKSNLWSTPGQVLPIIYVHPYHTATNSEAKCYVQTFKQTMRAAKGTQELCILNWWDFSFRTDPNATGVSPAEWLVGRALRTTVDYTYPPTTIETCKSNTIPW